MKIPYRKLWKTLLEGEPATSRLASAVMAQLATQNSHMALSTLSSWNLGAKTTLTARDRIIVLDGRAWTDRAWTDLWGQYRQWTASQHTVMQPIK